MNMKRQPFVYQIADLLPLSAQTPLLSAAWGLGARDRL
jgi:hypothetical protein